MNRVFKSLLTGLIGGPILVLVYSFPGIFTDTRDVLHLMVAGAAAAAIGFVLVGLFQNASFWFKAAFTVLAGAVAGFVFGLLRRGELAPFVSAAWGAVLLPCFVFIESGFKLEKKSKSPSSP